MKRDTRLLRFVRFRGLLALCLFLLMPITPALAGPTAISACGTISAPGNYVVTRNLTASGNCLAFTVSNVAIDLQGHKITGNGSGAAITDAGNSIAFIIVANGKISNFHTGIDLPTDDGQTADLILNMNVSGNTADGINIQGRDNNLSKVTTSNNGANGIVQGRCCDSIFKVTTNGNKADGVHLADEDYLSNVTSNGNSGNGVSGSVNSFVVNSVANKNAGNGVALTRGDNESGNNLVVSSVANGNQGDGILLSGFDQATDSKADKNHGHGIDFKGEFGLASSVTTNSNAGDGVSLICPGNAVRVSASGNGGANLDEVPSSDGPCTNVRNSAP